MKVGDKVWFKPKKCYVIIDFIEDDYVEVRYGTTGSTVETTLASLTEKSPDDIINDFDRDIHDALGEIAAKNAFEFYLRRNPDLIKQIEKVYDADREKFKELGVTANSLSEMPFMARLNVMGVYLNMNARALIAGSIYGDLS
jgi:hypothetical protein